MQALHAIRQLTVAQNQVPASLTEEDAFRLFAAVLDAGVPDLQLGALLTALRLKGESPSELLGFHRAIEERLYGLPAPRGKLLPLVVPAYGGARHETNLLPLLGLLLRRLRIPVLFHGTLEGNGRAAAAYVLREFGVLPCASLTQAQEALEQDHIAFVPIAALSPGLAGVLALRSRLGVRNSAHVVVKLIDPFCGAGVVMAGASTARYRECIGQFFTAAGTRALLLESTEGEPIANARRRPRIEFFDQGERHVLFEEEPGPVRPVAGLPATVDAPATAEWMRHALAGKVPIPHPVVNQLACCLFACGYTEDMNQAKAIAAVEAGSIGPGGRRPSSSSRAARI